MFSHPLNVTLTFLDLYNVIRDDHTANVENKILGGKSARDMFRMFYFGHAWQRLQWYITDLRYRVESI